jgi:cytochrome c oxidase cbb3-type subunit 4
MKAIISVENFVSSFVTVWWTPLFMVIFFAIVAYALWPRNKTEFDAAARMPLRED